MLATRRQVKPPLWVKGGRAFHLSACVARGRCCPDSCRGGRVGRHGRVGPEPDSFTATNATVFRSPRRRDRAALRLITSSNLVGNCTVVPGYSNKRKFGRGLKCRWAKELCRARARRGAARAGPPLCIVDYTGVWWGLRSARDGHLRGQGPAGNAPDCTRSRIAAFFLRFKVLAEF